MALAKDILAKKGTAVYATAPSTTVLEATRLMNEHRVGALLVLDGERIAGIFTERDVLVRVVAGALDPAITAVAAVMTTRITYCTPDATLDECRSVFTNKRIRHLPVLDHEKHLVGIITSGDVLAWESEGHQQTIKYLEEYIKS